jgi:hypothetical protein
MVKVAPWPWLAGRLDGATVRLDELADHGQADPGPGRSGRATAPEPVEDVRQLLAGDAGARDRVGHGVEARAISPNSSARPASGRTERSPEPVRPWLRNTMINALSVASPRARYRVR